MNKEQIEALIGFIMIKTGNYNPLLEQVTEWFEQNPIEPVVVGLSDEQVEELSDFISEHTSKLKVDIISEFLKTQTFAQPQQFEPIWGNSPKEASSFQLKGVWLDDNANVIDYTVILVEQRPEPPAQVVEVGQVWNHKESGNAYIIDEVIVLEGKTKIGEWAEDLTLVVYNPSNVKGGCKSKDIYRRPIEDFIAKFERVGCE